MVFFKAKLNVFNIRACNYHHLHPISRSIYILINQLCFKPNKDIN